MAVTAYDVSLTNFCKEKKFYPQVIGKIPDPIKKMEYPVWLVHTNMELYNQDPKALIVSGFHGEEVAGPWGVLRWIAECKPEQLKGINLSFIPIVNPWGFHNNSRPGPTGKPTNAGFYMPGEGPSPEGKILKDNITLIRPLADAGYLSLHEDSTSKEYYIYTFEPTELPGKFSMEMKAELGKHFLKPYNGIAYVDTTIPGQGPPCDDGLIWKFFDGSFDDWMFQLGVPRVAVTETPGAYVLQDRIEANMALINKFIDLVKRGV